MKRMTTNGYLFQHAAARRRLEHEIGAKKLSYEVSTRSRPKAAGVLEWRFLPVRFQFQHAAARRRLGQSYRHMMPHYSFNTQPPEGGWDSLIQFVELIAVSTRSRPKAAGLSRKYGKSHLSVSTRSRPKAAGCF